jgi:hypothetical protein
MDLTMKNRILTYAITLCCSAAAALFETTAAAQAACGSTAAGSCYTANTTPGCNNPTCCASVCLADPFCCNTRWDEFCAARAESTCRSGATCADAKVLSSSFIESYDFNTANGAIGGSSSCGDNDARATWRRWISTCSGRVTVSVCTEFAEGQVVLTVFDACNGQELACGSNEAGDNCFYGPLGTVSVSFGSAIGQDYLIRISTEGATNDSAGTLSISCASCGPGAPSCYVAHSTPGCNDLSCCTSVCAPDPFCCGTMWDSLCVNRAESICRSGETCPDAIAINPAFPSSYQYDTTVGAVGGGSSCGNDDDRATWRRWTSTCTGLVTVSTCTEFAEGQVVLAVFEGCDTNEIACGSNEEGLDCNLGPFGTSRVQFPAIEGRTYLIRISTEGASNDSAGSIAIECQTVCGTGESCYVAHSTPGCNDANCCASVCAADPYCCTNQWDGLCAARAESTCRSGATCADAPLLSASFPTSLDFNTSSGTVGGTSSCGSNDDRAVWRRYYATCTGLATIGTCTEFAEGQVVLSVFSSCGSAELACAANEEGDNCFYGPNGTVEVRFPVTLGQYYLVRISTEGAANDSAGTLYMSCARLGDLNSDGVVNAADLSILLGGWASGGPTDLNGDGTTNAADLSILLGAWG